MRKNLSWRRDRMGRQIYPFSAVSAAPILVIFLFAAANLWAQTQAPDSSSAQHENPPCLEAETASPPQTESQPHPKTPAPRPNATVENPCATKPAEEQNTRGKQTNRILWVVPNFAAVSANTQLPPLSTKGKFRLAAEDSFDYSSFVWTGILAGQEFGLQSYPEFRQGAAGYGRYYYHLFIDGVSGTFFTEAIVPSLTHEDPRYYTMEHGNILVRVGYALSRVVLTKDDSEGTSFNWSEVGGNLLEAGLSNAYYPPQERGGRQTMINWGAQVESAALNNIVKEFWPDIRRLLFRRK